MTTPIETVIDKVNEIVSSVIIEDTIKRIDGTKLDDLMKYCFESFGTTPTTEKEELEKVWKHKSETLTTEYLESINPTLVVIAVIRHLTKNEYRFLPKSVDSWSEFTKNYKSAILC